MLPFPSLFSSQVHFLPSLPNLLNQRRYKECFHMLYQSVLSHSSKIHGLVTGRPGCWYCFPSLISSIALDIQVQPSITKTLWASSSTSVKSKQEHSSCALTGQWGSWNMTMNEWRGITVLKIPLEMKDCNIVADWRTVFENNSIILLCL